jgi:hypothetical protein
LEVGSRSYETDLLAVQAGRPTELRLSPGTGQTAIAVLSLPPVVAALVSPVGLPPGATETVTRALAEAVQKEHALAVPRDQLDRALPQPAALCAATPECLIKLGQRTQASFVLAMQLAADGRGGYVLQGQVLDVSIGDQAAARDSACAGCDLTRTLDPARSLAAQLLLECSSRQRGTLEVTSTPPGANVRIDGHLRGLTPLSQPAFVGDRSVQVERAGFAPLSAVLPVAVGQTASLAVKLTPDPASRGRR